MGIFDLLELAGEASGKEAVAKVAKEVVPRSLSKDEKKQRYELKKKEQQLLKQQQEGHPPQQQHHDASEGQEYSGEGGGQGPTGGQQGPVYAGGMGRPNGRILVDADGNRHRDYSRGGDNGNTGYRGNFNSNGRGRGNFNGNRGGRGYGNGGVGRGYGNGGYNNGNRAYDNNGYNNNGYSNGNGGENQVYHEGNGQYQQDGNTYSNGGRQGYSRGDGKRRMEYRPKSKPSSVAASDADQKSEGKVEPAAEEVPQKEASAENVDAVPASESENSAGDAAKDDSKKVEGEGAQNVQKKQRDPNVKLLSGSAKRKLKKKNPKKEDSNDGDTSKKAADNVPEAIEEEKQEMTLEEYEKMLGKKKALVPSEPVERKMDPAFEGQKPLEKKKLEDEVLKLENAQRKPKEVAAKEGKARKITIQQYLKPADGTEYVPPPPPPRRDGPQSGGYRGGRGDGAYNGRSRDSSSESRVYNSGNGSNPPIVFRNVDATNGNGTPRRDGYQQRTEGGYQQGGYNGARANGAYQQGGGRVNGGYQERQDGYSGERRQGPYQQGGNQERRQGAYQQGGNQERRQGAYQQGGNQERRQGAYQQGGNQERRQGAYQQGGNQERRQGAYQQGGSQERRQGAYNGGGYQQGGGRRYPRATPVPEVNSAVQFPALGAALPAGSKAKEPSPSQSQA